MVFDRLRSGYQHLAQGEGEKRSSDEGIMERISRLSWKVKGVVIAFFALILIIFGFSGSSEVSSQMLETPKKEIEPDSRFLHIILPVNAPSIHACKSLQSLAMLDYPVPNIMTWNTTFDDAGAAEGGAHTARISGVIDFFDMILRLGSERANDLVLILEGYDTWFQLRPDVFMERYYEITRQSNNRVVRRLGQKPMDDAGISQKIVFGAQKHCSREADDPACYAVPESPLGSSVYGPTTDRGNDREKYLRAGFIMGDLNSTKILFAKALEIVNADREKVTAQDAFSRLFGEQELWRETVREKNMGFFSKTYHGVLQFFGIERKSILAPHPTHRKYSVGIDTPSEYGIGLDYEGLLSASTKDKDFDWVVHNDTQAIKAIKQKNQVSSSNRLRLPEDIQRSLEPFWSRNPEPKFPNKQSWLDVPLYTNLWNGNVPASIVHSSPRSSENSPRTSEWGNLWTQPYSRILMNAHVNEPYHGFAVLKSSEEEVSFWGLHREKWRLRNHFQASGQDKKKEWIRWEWMCKKDDMNEMFRDGGKPWRAPRIEY